MPKYPDFHEFFTDFKSDSKIFANYYYLTPEYNPQKLFGRETQLKKIWSEVKYALQRRIPLKNFFLYGFPGTGKTATINLIIKEIIQWAQQNNVLVPNICVNNCAIYNTPYRILRDICNHFKVYLPQSGISTEDAYTRILKIMERQKQSQFILILDELDFLFKNKKVANNFLYKLIRNPLSKQESSYISIIGITNEIKLIDLFDERVKSSFTPEKIYFPPYSALELQKILYTRAEKAFKPYVLASGTIELIAGHFAQLDGDCRKSLAILRIAGEIADKHQDSQVTERHVKIALKDYIKTQTRELIQSLPYQSKIILQSIRNLQRKKQPQSLITGNIYKEYMILCKKLNCHVLSMRHFSNHLKNLEKLDLINIEYLYRGKKGNTRKITFYFS